MKKCSCCKIEKCLSSFPIQSSSKDGLSYICKSCKTINDRKYREKNKAKIRQLKKEYYEANKESISEKNKKKYKDSRSHVIAKSLEWKRKNKAKHNSNCMKRYVTKLKASPKWLDEFMLLYIEEMYDQAIKISELTNSQHHVDHIVPLRGKTVCGLHVPWNLQIITASENCSKRNELPEESLLFDEKGWKHG